MSSEQEVTLYKTKLRFMSNAFPNELMDELLERREDLHKDFVRNQCRIVMKGYLYGEAGESQTVSYPSDWWSAFKQRWFPEWLLKRYPACITTYKINLLTLYPHFKVSLPDQHHVLKYTVNKTESLEPVDENSRPRR